MGLCKDGGKIVYDALKELESMGYWDAMRTFGRRVMDGTYDWKFSRYTYDVFGMEMQGDQFGNFFAGFVSYARFGPFGVFATRTGGHLYSAGDGEWPIWDDLGSREYINLGVSEARDEDGYIRKWGW